MNFFKAKMEFLICYGNSTISNIEICRVSLEDETAGRGRRLLVCYAGTF
jgi:hypothetical protein